MTIEKSTVCAFSKYKINLGYFLNKISICEKCLPKCSPSKKVCVICLIESPLKMMKNAFYFISKAFFVLKKTKFLSWLFGHIGKTAWFER